MDREKLAAFMAVAREKNFSRAAATIFRTQPAVSHAVKSLERQLGETLFVRHGRETHLTRAGEILFEHVDEAKATIERAKVRLQALRQLREGRLTVAASDTTACYILPDSLRIFREKYPGVEVRILNRPSPIATHLVADGDADMALITLPMATQKVQVMDLGIREDVGICAPSNPLAGRRRASLEELNTFPLLLLDHGANTRSFIDDQFREAAITPNIAMELGSIEVIKRLVRLNFGVSVVPRIAVRREIEDNEICAFAVFARSEARHLGAIIPNKGLLSRAAEVYMDILVGSLRKKVL